MTIVLAIIRLYQKWISPLTPPRCGFVPTCSGYAYEVIARDGLARGLPRAVRRLLKCHPLHRGGVDPVP
jgi:putative membrane protein insertion efficiency factor